MPKMATKAADNVFYKARIAAASWNDRLGSREGASEVTGIDRTRLANIELGTINPHPEEVLMLSDTYNAPELQNHFCSHLCPLGIGTISPIELEELERVTLQLISAMKSLPEVKDGIIDIAADGVIDAKEKPRMQTIRTKLGKAIKVTSGYRCVKHNADPKVGGSRTSRHLYGIAADWRTKDRSVNPVALGIIAAAQGFGAVGIYWHDKAAIVHTDTRGGKATWLCVQPGVYPSTTYNKFVLPTIEQGCEGAANRAATVMLQRLLGIPHDGSFGPATTKALMTAQRKHGLVPDGICGPKSWTALSGADKYL